MPSQDATLVIECTPESYSGVHESLRRLIASAAQSYHAQCPHEPPLRITAGARTLRRQAELMAQMDDRQLAALYGSGGRPQYIDAILALPRRDADGVYQVLACRDGGYISRHLGGTAADLGLRDVRRPDLLKRLLLAAGAAILDESVHGIPCLHVYLPGVPPAIVRQ